MEVSKNTACLEITNDAAKFAIGYAIGGQPVLIYKTSRPLKGFLQGGNILNGQAIADIIKSFLHIEDESARLNINALNLSIVLPPLGFQVYQDNKVTNIVSPQSLVAPIDITNLTSLVKKDIIPGGNVIVDIIPDAFIIDGDKAYKNPPLGEKTGAIAVKAKIQTLPAKVVSSYKNIVSAAGFRIKDAAIAPYCASQLIALNKDLPENYILLDLGAQVTSLSFIGATSPYASDFFVQGGDNLTNSIALALGISFDEAEILKKDYGYDERVTGYKSPLAETIDKTTGKRTRYYQADLNNAIASFFEKFVDWLNNAASKLLAKQPPSKILDSLPIIITGGGSLLKGLDKLIQPAFKNRSLVHYVPDVLGARDPAFTNLLGLIVAESSYRGTLEENYHGVGSLSRDQ
jgi:cell division protein FtsA